MLNSRCGAAQCGRFGILSSRMVTPKGNERRSQKATATSKRWAKLTQRVTSWPTGSGSRWQTVNGYQMRSGSPTRLD